MHKPFYSQKSRIFFISKPCHDYCKGQILAQKKKFGLLAVGWFMHGLAILILANWCFCLTFSFDCFCFAYLAYGGMATSNPFQLSGTGPSLDKTPTERGGSYLDKLSSTTPVGARKRKADSASPAAGSRSSASKVLREKNGRNLRM